MGTPVEYGFNDISKENILKADPLSFVLAVLVHSDPFSRQGVLCHREGGHSTSLPTVLFDPATLPYSCASLCQDSCIMVGM